MVTVVSYQFCETGRKPLDIWEIEYTLSKINAILQIILV
jgi:hypothetical protein